METALSKLRMNKSVFSVGALHEPAREKFYWLSKTPAERLEALETMRQIIYGYDPASTRLQRIFAVAEREQS